MQQKKTPYVQWIHPDDDFVVPEGYTCIPPAIGHLDDTWALFKTPHTSDEMGIMISIVQDRIKEELEFLAHEGNVPAETRIGLLLGMSLRHLKRMEILGEKKGELKFEKRADRIEAIVGSIEKVVMADGYKKLRVALAQYKGGRKGAEAAGLAKSGQAEKDRTNIMADFNARLKENHDRYKPCDQGFYKSVETIAKETAKAHPNATGKPIMSGEAIKREHYRRAKRKTKRAK